MQDTPAEQGALRVVPGYHRRLESWAASERTDSQSARTARAHLPAELDSEAVALSGRAGSLVLWHSVLPHGPAPNIGSAPRVSAYVSMLPVDAAPFLGPGRPADGPLGMSDAGTLAYFGEGPPAAHPDAGGMPSPVASGSPADGSCDVPVGAASVAQDSLRIGQDAASEGWEVSCLGRNTWEESNEVPRVWLRRQSRARRVERWRLRLPLLDEDPTEEQLAQRPPGEGHGRPAELTPLGRRLVGLDAWEGNAQPG